MFTRHTNYGTIHQTCNMSNNVSFIWLKLTTCPFFPPCRLRSLEATTLSTAAFDSISTLLDSYSEPLFFLSPTNHHDSELSDLRGRNGDPVLGVLDSDG